MLGWNFGVHRFAAPELRGHQGDLGSISALIAARTGALEVPQATGEDRLLAAWRAGLGGIYWLDELVDAGKAAHTMRGGYPESYLVRCEDFRTRIRAGLPNEQAGWPAELHDAQEPERRGGPIVDERELQDCDAGEWLLVEAWHEADQHAARRAAGGGVAP